MGIVEGANRSGLRRSIEGRTIFGKIMETMKNFRKDDAYDPKKIEEHWMIVLEQLILIAIICGSNFGF